MGSGNGLGIQMHRRETCPRGYGCLAFWRHGWHLPLLLKRNISGDKGNMQRYPKINVREIQIRLNIESGSKTFTHKANSPSVFIGKAEVAKGNQHPPKNKVVGTTAKASRKQRVPRSRFPCPLPPATRFSKGSMHAGAHKDAHNFLQHGPRPPPRHRFQQPLYDWMVPVLRPGLAWERQAG